MTQQKRAKERKKREKAQRKKEQRAMRKLEKATKDGTEEEDELKVLDGPQYFEDFDMDEIRI